MEKAPYKYLAFLVALASALDSTHRSAFLAGRTTASCHLLGRLLCFNRRRALEPERRLGSRGSPSGPGHDERQVAGGRETRSWPNERTRRPYPVDTLTPSLPRLFVSPPALFASSFAKPSSNPQFTPDLVLDPVPVAAGHPSRAAAPGPRRLCGGMSPSSRNRARGPQRRVPGAHQRV